ncbi:MAG: ABC transporter permease subunit [Byssovorax sp.]
MSILDIFLTYRSALLGGLWVTLKLCFAIWGMGLIFGFFAGIAGSRWPRTAGRASRVVSFVLSGIPTIVLLFWLHYPLQSLFSVVIDPFYTAAAGLALVNAVAVGDLVRKVREDFPKQYLLAARACGLSPRVTFLHIQLPLMLRQLLPPLVMLQVTMLQATLFASLISVDEMFRIANRINATVYRPVEVYTAVALLYVVLCLPLNGMALALRARFTRDVSET